MDYVKMKRLRADVPDLGDGSVRHVSQQEAAAILNELRSRLGLERGASGLKVLLEIRKRSVPFGGNVEQDGPELRRALAVGGASLGDSLFVNWHRFDDIDSVQADVLVRHFEHFWYPKADDIDIFDKSLAWCVSVDSDGWVRIAKLKTAPRAT